MSPWPQLSKPVYAGDNHRIAVAMSKQTIGKPPARPTGGSFSVTRRDSQTKYDPSPFDDDDFLFPYADRRGF